MNLVAFVSLCEGGDSAVLQQIQPDVNMSDSSVLLSDSDVSVCGSNKPLTSLCNDGASAVLQHVQPEGDMLNSDVPLSDSKMSLEPFYNDAPMRLPTTIAARNDKVRQ